MKVKVTPRVLSWLDGTGIGQSIMRVPGADALIPEQLDDPEDEWDVATMILKTREAPSRADGSMWPDLTQREIQELAEWSTYMTDANSDAASESNQTGDMGGLADLNAARAQVKRCQEALDRIRRTPQYAD